MKTSSKLWLASGVAAVLMTVAGCSDNSNDDDDGDRTSVGSGSATVPDSSGTTVDGFIAYLKGLDSSDETSEPLLIKDGFAVPPNESDDSPPPT